MLLCPLVVRVDVLLQPGIPVLYRDLRVVARVVHIVDQVRDDN